MFANNMHLMAGPAGGLQINCVKTGADAELGSVTYFFNKNAAVDSLFGITNVVFEKIAIDPKLEKMEYTYGVPWLRFPDGRDVMHVMPADHVIWWEIEKKDSVRDAAMIFVAEAQDFCRNPHGVPTHYTLDSDAMFPPRAGSNVPAAAARLMAFITKPHH